MTEDPVVVYDMLREAANRLGAIYARRVTIGGINDPAVQAIRAIDREVAAVDLDDIPAQLALTADLWARFEAERDRDG